MGFSEVITLGWTPVFISMLFIMYMLFYADIENNTKICMTEPKLTDASRNFLLISLFFIIAIQGYAWLRLVFKTMTKFAKVWPIALMFFALFSILTFVIFTPLIILVVRILHDMQMVDGVYCMNFFQNFLGLDFLPSEIDIVKWALFGNLSLLALQALWISASWNVKAKVKTIVEKGNNAAVEY